MGTFQQASQISENPYSLPSLSDPPLQLFGGPSANASPIIPDFDFTEGLVDGLDHEGGPEDGNDAKRRRIARACDMCRKKKIKCDGKMPSCTHCINYKTECIFTQVEKKRNPPKGAKYIEGLENRLGRMEALLKLSGLLGDDNSDRTDLGTLEKRLADRSLQQGNGLTQPTVSEDSSTHAIQPQKLDVAENTSQEQNYSSVKKPEEQEGVEEISDMMCSLVTNSCGETRYIGSSSGFSIFSPKGRAWVNEKTGDNSFGNLVESAEMNDVKWNYWKPDVFGDLFGRRVFHQLPPKNETLSLLRDFFENFNCMFPLFHEPTFMNLVDRTYSGNPYEGSGWWASLNVALAIAHRLRVMSRLVPQAEDDKAWGYLKNAMAVLTELTLRNTDLLSVQALLGMALFLMGTPNPQPSFFLVAAAIRLANSIGLHKRGSGFGLNLIEMEQRKRVFWIAYIVDKDICLRSGRPPAQDDDDMSVDLPMEEPYDNIGNIPLADGKGKANLFRLMCTFATIESKVYKLLYSTKASKQSDGDLLNTIGELDKELEEWKDAIPLDFRPGHDIKASHTPLILHVVTLHFAYNNCLATIHRMAVHSGIWTNRLSNYAIQGLNARPLNPRVFQSGALCVQAARASIHLIRYIPKGDYSCVWLIIYFPVSALVTLFANVLQNPQDPRARSDVKLMDQVINFLSTLIITEEQGGIKRMFNVCTEFERIARVILEKSDKESSRRKRRSSKMHVDENNPPASQQTTQQRAVDINAQSNGAPSPKTPFTPVALDNTNNQTIIPSSQDFSPSMSNMNLPFDSNSLTSNQYSDIIAPPNGFNALTPSMSHFQTDNPLLASDGSPSEYPLVPQDLWDIPMTLEWPWAELAGMTPRNFSVMDGLDGQEQQGPPMGDDISSLDGNQAK